MTGANYTGGKRNVARTRFRDSTRRVQKNHFGRRRLGILSRSLVNGTRTNKVEEPACGISGILLEHAQREISRPPNSNAACETRALDAFSFDQSSATGPSRTSSNITPSSSKVTHILESGSYSSLRAEMDRILEFSRTVGLCNYATSKQHVPTSLVSHLDSEPRRSSPRPTRDEIFMTPTSKSSGRQHINACIGHAAQIPEDPQIPQSRPRSNSPREAASSTYDYEHLEDYVSQSPARSICTVESELCRDQGSPWLLEGDPYTTNPFTPSFDALEFSTSPLPPSSPLPSSTTYGLLPSPQQESHGAERSILDSDSVPLPSMMSGSRELGTSRYVSSHRIIPDLASASPLQHRPHSNLTNKVPTLLASSSEADLITDLLACDNPWNAIGNLLNLPPIPSPDATYFDNIRALHTLSPERASSIAWPRLGQMDIRKIPSPARFERTRLSGVHSDGDLLVRRDPSQVEFSREPYPRASSLLLSRDLPATKRARSPAPPFHSGCEARYTEPQRLSPSKSILVSNESPQPMLMPQDLPVSPRPPDSTSGADSICSSALVKTPFPCTAILTPQGSAPPSPKNLNLQNTSVTRSPGVVSTQSNAIPEFDLTSLISKVSSTTQTATSKGKLPKLECPDLFQDEDDGLTGTF